VSPVTWGVEENVIERFGHAGVLADHIGFERDTYVFTFPAPPTELLAAFRSFYGPTMNAFAAAEANGRADDLQRELEELFVSQNTVADGTTTAIPATFLRVTVQL
jgi:hypothetical protein